MSCEYDMVVLPDRKSQSEGGSCEILPEMEPKEVIGKMLAIFSNEIQYYVLSKRGN